MRTPSDHRESPPRTSERPNDVLSFDLAVRLWARARELEEEGDLIAARDVALDATVVWAIERASLEEDVLLELLHDVWGADADAILTSARHSTALSVWRLGSPHDFFDDIEDLDDGDFEVDDSAGDDDLALDAIASITDTVVFPRRASRHRAS